MPKEVKERSGLAVGLNAGHVRLHHLPTSNDHASDEGIVAAIMMKDQGLMGM